MTDQELQQDIALRRALVSAFLVCGMRPLDGCEGQLVGKLTALGVVADMSAGYLRLSQLGSDISLSGACERLRRELPTCFAADPKRDSIASREDFERGSQSEISAAKSKWISEHSLEAWEKLPNTRKEAERRNAPVNADMTRNEWLALPFSERVRLSAVLGPETLQKIMGRKG